MWEGLWPAFQGRDWALFNLVPSCRFSRLFLTTCLSNAALTSFQQRRIGTSLQSKKSGNFRPSFARAYDFWAGCFNRCGSLSPTAFRYQELYMRLHNFSSCATILPLLEVHTLVPENSSHRNLWPNSDFRMRGNRRFLASGFNIFQEWCFPMATQRTGLLVKKLTIQSRYNHTIEGLSLLGQRQSLVSCSYAVERFRRIGLRNCN
ncbi:hypothetical protein QBC38DRAFT_58345 [Podospora fimiseda]|uniref:Uncharacterized protein n=1 Tax=Podospora fimiseda TaxID=252190 RepID=A0AAN7BGY5_9PEZI|nr:hypothetical protein QBC38DRAFT_58345 [Podospora fimiseda]